MSTALTEFSPPGLIQPGRFSASRDLAPGRSFILRVSHTSIRVLSWRTADTIAQDYPVELLEYKHPNGTTLVLDLEEPVDTLRHEEREVVEYLWKSGRRVLADKLITMLEEMVADEEPKISILSLQDMARLLVEQKDFADPFISPARGIVHAQWRIDGNGALVWGFLGHDQILVVVQADETSARSALDISTSESSQKIVEEFRHLVPRLN